VTGDLQSMSSAMQVQPGLRKLGLSALEVTEYAGGVTLAAMTARSSSDSRPSTADAPRDELLRRLYRERAERLQAEETSKTLQAAVSKLEETVADHADDIDDLKEENVTMHRALRERTDAEKKVDRNIRMQTAIFRAQTEQRQQQYNQVVQQHNQVVRQLHEVKRELVSVAPPNAQIPSIAPANVQVQADQGIEQQDCSPKPGFGEFRERLLQLLVGGTSTNWTPRPEAAAPQQLLKSPTHGDPVQAETPQPSVAVATLPQQQGDASSKVETAHQGSAIGCSQQPADSPKAKHAPSLAVIDSIAASARPAADSARPVGESVGCLALSETDARTMELPTVREAANASPLHAAEAVPLPTIQESELSEAFDAQVPVVKPTLDLVPKAADLEDTSTVAGTSDAGSSARSGSQPGGEADQAVNAICPASTCASSQSGSSSPIAALGTPECLEAQHSDELIEPHASPVHFNASERDMEPPATEPRSAMALDIDIAAETQACRNALHHLMSPEKLSRPERSQQHNEDATPTAHCKPLTSLSAEQLSARSECQADADKSSPTQESASSDEGSDHSSTSSEDESDSDSDSSSSSGEDDESEESQEGEEDEENSPKGHGNEVREELPTAESVITTELEHSNSEWSERPVHKATTPSMSDTDSWRRSVLTMTADARAKIPQRSSLGLRSRTPQQGVEVGTSSSQITSQARGGKNACIMEDREQAEFVPAVSTQAHRKREVPEHSGTGKSRPQPFEAAASSKGPSKGVARPVAEQGNAQKCSTRSKNLEATRDAGRDPRRTSSESRVARHEAEAPAQQPVGYFKPPDRELDSLRVQAMAHAQDIVTSWQRHQQHQPERVAPCAPTLDSVQAEAKGYPGSKPSSASSALPKLAAPQRVEVKYNYRGNDKWEYDPVPLARGKQGPKPGAKGKPKSRLTSLNGIYGPSLAGGGDPRPLPKVQSLPTLSRTGSHGLREAQALVHASPQKLAALK